MTKHALLNRLNSTHWKVYKLLYSYSCSSEASKSVHLDILAQLELDIYHLIKA